ncbi:MAG: type IV pilus twitching motility protein PilT [Candidatus Eisenbacteria bacterium]|uniref:Type IV pilus twitching motility protein PilT n=1 Tax=Eiseniibacteriota bacterium TaxID=2212470 RepID=A0A538U2Q1_UNCEI|nr:MAG: type IV pilus twitching motility protein PilT [Candidatus Eisenbacteria bacterium]
MARIDEIFTLVRQQGASDVHLTAGSPPMVRVNGDIVPVPYPPLQADVLEPLLFEMMDPVQRARYDRDRDVDFSYEVPGALRLRCNIYEQARGVAGAFRLLPDQILSMEQLGLPAAATRFAEFQRGLVLVAGPPGSGKSSTLAAMIDQINRTKAKHILTLEDPIEYRHINRKSLITQREIRRHTPSFAQGIKAALREDPDIILVGEMRDPETMSMAISAASTGQLVLGTLHTRSAMQAVDRIVDSFEGDRQTQVRLILAESLRGVIAQRLIRRTGGGGRALAVEILVGNQAVASLIRDKKTFQLASVIQTGKREGMQSMDESILALVQAGTISSEEAAQHMSNRDAMSGGARPAGPAPPRPGEAGPTRQAA